MDWSNLFSIVGIILIGFTIYDFFMSVLCGIGNSEICGGDGPTYATFCVSGALCICIALILHNEKPVALDEEE